MARFDGARHGPAKGSELGGGRPPIGPGARTKCVRTPSRRAFAARGARAVRTPVAPLRPVLACPLALTAFRFRRRKA